MKKLALVAALAGLGFAAPAYAMDDSAAQGRIQLAQAGVSISVGERPAARSRVIVRSDRGDRGRHHGWRNHRAQADVVVVKKRKPATRTYIITR